MSGVLLVSGSPRRASLNGALLDELGGRLSARVAVDRLQPSEVQLPVFDQDLEARADVVGHVKALHDRFASSAGFVVATPEYNGQLPPYLKNLVDWVSRLPRIDPAAGDAFAGRPVLLCSASTGWSGGALAIPHARALFGYVGCTVLGPALSVPHADHVLGADGDLPDPMLAEQLDTLADAMLAALGRAA